MDYTQLVAPVLTGVFAWVGTVVALKADVRTLKQMVDWHGNRLDKLEESK